MIGLVSTGRPENETLRHSANFDRLGSCEKFFFLMSGMQLSQFNQAFLNSMILILKSHGSRELHINHSLDYLRFDLQPFCELAFFVPHHGWITGLPIVFLDQSQASLLKLSRLRYD